MVEQLTGQPATSDYSNALKTGYDLIEVRWPAWIDEHLGIVSRLPSVVAPGSPIGVVSCKAAAETGLPEGLRRCRRSDRWHGRLFGLRRAAGRRLQYDVGHHAGVQGDQFADLPSSAGYDLLPPAARRMVASRGGEQRGNRLDRSDVSRRRRSGDGRRGRRAFAERGRGVSAGPSRRTVPVFGPRCPRILRARVLRHGRRAMQPVCRAWPWSSGLAIRCSMRRRELRTLSRKGRRGCRILCEILFRQPPPSPYLPPAKSTPRAAAAAATSGCNAGPTPTGRVIHRPGMRRVGFRSGSSRGRRYALQ